MFVKNTKNGLCITAPLNERKMDLISVIVPVFCNKQNLEYTLSSILIQDYPEIELIVSDDDSADFEESMVLNILKKYDCSCIKNIIVRKNTRNLGIVKHENILIKIAHGQYIKFISPGDAFTSNNSLTQLFNFAKKTGANIVSSQATVISEPGGKICYNFPSERCIHYLNYLPTEKLFAKICTRNLISAVGALFNKQFLLNCNFDIEYRNLEDWPLWLKVTRNNIRIPCLSYPTVYYSMGGISSKNQNAFKSDVLRIDMIHCYEKEIFAYKNRLSALQKYYCLYKFIGIKDYNSYSLLKKMVFNIVYLPLALFESIKFWLKKFSTRSKKGG
jgi:glycosyltransferase involved in cell wall biosynthesis